MRPGVLLPFHRSAELGSGLACAPGVTRAGAGAARGRRRQQRDSLPSWRASVVKNDSSRARDDCAVVWWEAMGPGALPEGMDPRRLGGVCCAGAPLTNAARAKRVVVSNQQRGMSPGGDVDGRKEQDGRCGSRCCSDGRRLSSVGCKGAVRLVESNKK